MSSKEATEEPSADPTSEYGTNLEDSKEPETKIETEHISVLNDNLREMPLGMHRTSTSNGNYD